MPFAWVVGDSEVPAQGAFLEVEDARVVDAVEAAILENPEQGFVVPPMSVDFYIQGKGKEARVA